MDIAYAKEVQTAYITSTHLTAFLSSLPIVPDGWHYFESARPALREIFSRLHIPLAGSPTPPSYITPPQALEYNPFIDRPADLLPA